MTQVTAILKVDIFSTFRSSVQYGKKGDKVRIIAVRDHVMIVENKNGNKRDSGGNQ